MGASAGRVLLIPKGDWNANTTYTGLDWVRHNGAAWVCKNTCTNIEPTSENTNYWQSGFYQIPDNYDFSKGGIVEITPSYIRLKQ